MTVLAIDPGSERSAWVLFSDEIHQVGMNDNVGTLDLIRSLGRHPFYDAVVIEKVESYGMPVGAEVFETVRWAGRFEEAAQPLPVHRLGRKTVKLHLCQSARAKDANVRQALIDRYGGPSAIRKGGPLYGIHGDLWAALAVGVTWLDTEGGAR